MNDNKTLYLQAMGCDFWKDDQELLENSDCGNYRIRGYIVDKYGRDLFVEFTNGYKRRTTNKRTGQPLKKAIVEHNHKLCIDTQYDNADGSWRDCKLERELWEQDLTYCTEDILKAVNYMAGGDIYKNVVICDELPKIWCNMAAATEEIRAAVEKLGTEKMLEAAGFREKTALENFVTYRTNKRDNTVELFYRRWNGTPISCTWSIDRECWVN